MEHKEIFVKLEEHGQVKKALDDIKSKIEKAKANLQNIKKIKEDEDAKLAEWEENTQTMTTKIDEVHRHLSNN